MAAGHEQRHEGEIGPRIGQHGRQQVAFQVMDADRRQVPRPGERLRHAGADEQGARQARAGRIGHGTDVGHLQAGLFQHLAGERHDAADVGARGEFRHHATVFLVHGDLGMQRVREQSPFRTDGCDTGFVAGAFKAENNHGGRVYN
ncbi:hypothetical protein G6F65_019887 [Rhizopus arrhizus]|nr:hypothetical protein G6F65_019887 [Rhizopus arrhizus]